MDELERIFGGALSGGPGGGAAGAAPPSAPPPAPLPAPGAERAGGEAPEQTTPMASLASYVMSRFQENEAFRRTSGTSERLDYCIRAQRCAFSGEQRAKLSARFGDDLVSRMFVPVTSTKVRAARSMLVDLVNQAGEPLFHLEPSPVPDGLGGGAAEGAARRTAAAVNRVFAALAATGVEELPREAFVALQERVAAMAASAYDEEANAREEEARVRAARMERKVWDVLEEGGWNEAFAEYIDHICTYGTGVVVGPVVRSVARNRCRADRNGVPRYGREVRRAPVFEAVNPCDCYPAPDAKDVDDGPLCIRVRYTGDELARYAQAEGGDAPGEGWIAAQVEGVLSRHPRGGVRLDVGTFSPDRRWCENNGFLDTADCTFEGVRCFASVRGSELLEMGVSRTRDGAVGAREFHRVEAVVVENRVVYCRVYGAAEALPVSKGVFYTLPGSWWGESVADKVAATQCVVNNCLASLLANMPASSGPIYWVNDVQRLVNKQQGLRLKAGMTLGFTSSMAGGGGPPIGALSVPSNASELLAVWRAFQTQADLDSGLPAYTEGQSAGQSGALRTASGLAIFTEASTRGLKMVMTTTDRCVISRVARLTADWVLLNDDDMDLKGDVEVRSVGLIGRVLRAQRDQQRLQTLQLVLNSPLLSGAVGVRGAVALLRPSLRDVDVNPDDVLPSMARMAELEAVQAIRQVFDATRAAEGVQAAAGPAAGQGAQEAPAAQGGAPAIEGAPAPDDAPPAPGSVAERRGAA